ncbi:hypothetical protein AGMMS49938_14120 [Fibrobacterales bacterium]|nr:hypothetical protein AGMMS49938_14120 [Fibrobacterales bacterium]
MMKEMTIAVDEDIYVELKHMIEKNAINDFLGSLMRTHLVQKKTNVARRSLQSFYGAFQDEPIPDKVEIRRRFHEKSFN